MDAGQSTNSPPAKAARRVVFAVAAGLLLVGGLLAYVLAKRWAVPTEVAAAADDDPRLTYATPFGNVRPEVKYVGDEACAECHFEHAEAYRRHPMGRSLTPAARAAADERYDAAAGNPFEAFGYRLEVECRGGRVFHRETRTDAQGKPAATLEAEIQYILGSGAHGKSYLVNRDGLLFQSPVSWFTARQTWAVSPGFTEDHHFERPVVAKCLFCHANDADAIETSINRYRAPVFHAFAIGCERCHGPGALHVAARQTDVPPPKVDPTIVNPRHLEPALREAVCQQCHLRGEQRVLRRGRRTFDFRPGLPLHLFWSVFVRAPTLTSPRRAVGQVEEMYASRCFQASAGQMGCISCHDPHALPAADKKVAYYRQRCLSCHGAESCRLPPAARRKQNADDSCIACHMPRRETVDVGHTALTDHRIRRRAEEADGVAPRPWAGEMPMVHFHRDLIAAGGPDIDRDLGIALITVLQENNMPSRWVGSMALPLLEAAVRTWPDDLAAGDALSAALLLAGRTPEALVACEQVLARCPDREWTLVNATAVAEALGRPEVAIDYYRRALALSPWSSRYRYHLAKLLSERQEWAAAAAECRELLRRNPHHSNARSLLVSSLARSGDVAQARAEFQALLAQQPPDPDGLRRSFEDLLK
jgi:hypothetical protein